MEIINARKILQPAHQRRTTFSSNESQFKNQTLVYLSCTLMSGIWIALQNGKPLLSIFSDWTGLCTNFGKAAVSSSLALCAFIVIATTEKSARPTGHRRMNPVIREPEIEFPRNALGTNLAQVGGRFGR